MNIELKTTAMIAKSIAIKREKDDSENEVVVAHLKFAGAFIDRPHIDAFCGQSTTNWSSDALFDENGLPIAMLDIAVRGFEASVTGYVSGPDLVDGSIQLVRAKLTDVSFMLVNLGAHLSGHFSWLIAGDEASDTETLLGKECTLSVVIQDAEQGDWVKDAMAQKAAA